MSPSPYTYFVTAPSFVLISSWLSFACGLYVYSVCESPSSLWILSYHKYNRYFLLLQVKFNKNSRTHMGAAVSFLKLILCKRFCNIYHIFTFIEVLFHPFFFHVCKASFCISLYIRLEKQRIIGKQIITHIFKCKDISI